MVDTERVQTRQLIVQWHDRARIDYSALYVNEYIAYNAWFRKVTQCSEDKEALRRLMKRFVIWDDYEKGRVLTALVPLVEQVANITKTSQCAGRVRDAYDWKGLINFWYQTRCDLFHGSVLPTQNSNDTRVRLAYESLQIFMSEIIRRMRHSFTDSDFERLTEVRALLKSPNGPAEDLIEIETGLYQKFIRAPDIWNVDMERA